MHRLFFIQTENESLLWGKIYFGTRGTNWYPGRPMNPLYQTVKGADASQMQLWGPLIGSFGKCSLSKNLFTWSTLGLKTCVPITFWRPTLWPITLRYGFNLMFGYFENTGWAVLSLSLNFVIHHFWKGDKEIGKTWWNVLMIFFRSNMRLWKIAKNLSFTKSFTIVLMNLNSKKEMTSGAFSKKSVQKRGSRSGLLALLKMLILYATKHYTISLVKYFFNL